MKAELLADINYMKINKYSLKIDQADSITERFKENLMNIFWNDEAGDFCDSRSLIPWIQEEAEYKIKRLKLKKTDQFRYLQRIDQCAGDYAEEI